MKKTKMTHVSLQKIPRKSPAKNLSTSIWCSPPKKKSPEFNKNFIIFLLALGLIWSWQSSEPFKKTSSEVSWHELKQFKDDWDFQRQTENQQIYHSINSIKTSVDNLKKSMTKLGLSQPVDNIHDYAGELAQQKESLKQVEKQLKEVKKITLNIPVVKAPDFSQKVVPYNRLNEDILYDTHQVYLKRLKKDQYQEMETLQKALNNHPEASQILANFKDKQKLQRKALGRQFQHQRYQFWKEGFLVNESL